MKDTSPNPVARWPIPLSWGWAHMGELCQVTGGGTPSTADATNFDGGDIPWITPADLSGYTAKFISRGSRQITTKGLESSGARMLPQGTVLFTSRAPIGYVAIASNQVSTNQGFKSFTPPEGLLPDYLYYYLHRAKGLALELACGTTFLEISGKRAADIPLPVPPTAEQHRIVAKIEELFSDLDAGVAALERVRIALKRYRASVLKAAVEGRLTEAWREENPDVEPADELLGRILDERRERWEREQLAKYETKGKKPLSGWREKYPEPFGPDVDRMPELPDGWCWTSLPQLGFIDRGRSRHRPRNASHLYGGTHPFVQTGDIRQADTFVMEFHQTYSEAGLAQSRLWPKGTLCITIAANIAATAILGFDACFPDSVVGLLPASKDLSVRYVELYLRTVKSGLEALAPATAQKNINLDTLQQLPVVLPPYEEQLEIVAEVDRRLLAETVVAREVVNSILRAGRLRQSILTRAFEGCLVPQDPSDEPASVLLQRIKTEPQHAALTMVDEGYNGPGPDSERVERARLH